MPTESPPGWVVLNKERRHEKEIIGDVTVRLMRYPNYGLYRVLLDGNVMGVIDLFQANITMPEDVLGRHTLKAGDHVLRFECVGRNPSSKGIFLGLDCLIICVPVYARSAGKDLRDLQVKP